MQHKLAAIVIQFSLFISFGGYAQETIANKAEMCNLLKKMIENDQLYRNKIPDSFNPNKQGFTKKEIDSMELFQRKIDNYNTEKLIELTTTYGWISDERIDCPKLNIWLIFRHSQPQYFEKISIIIEKEHEAKRLNNFQYQLIKDHILGRPRG